MKKENHDDENNEDTSYATTGCTLAEPIQWKLILIYWLIQQETTTARARHWQKLRNIWTMLRIHWLVAFQARTPTNGCKKWIPLEYWQRRQRRARRRRFRSGNCGDASCTIPVCSKHDKASRVVSRLCGATRGRQVQEAPGDGYPAENMFAAG